MKLPTDIDGLRQIEAAVAASTWRGERRDQLTVSLQCAWIVRNLAASLSSIDKPFQQWTTAEIIRAVLPSG
jgi:hypothetical protein